MGFFDWIGKEVDENIVQPLNENVIKPAETWVNTNVVEPVIQAQKNTY